MNNRSNIAKELKIQKKSRFKEVRVSLGLNQEEYANSLKLTQSNVSKIELPGNDRGVPEKAILLLEKLYNVDPNWLETGEGEMFLPTKKPGLRLEAKPVTLMPDQEVFKDTDHKFAYSDEGVIAMRVRIVPAKAQLGYLRGYADPEWFESFEYETIPIDKEKHGTYLGFETVGYSMVNLTSEYWAEKSIFPKRIAIGREVHPNAWRDSKLHIHSNDAWVIVHKHGILLKEIIKHEVSSGIITIHSWNPDKEQYPDEDIYLGDVVQIFNVLQVIDKRR